ncbi:MAG TPA: UDP-N-acetylglucosamine 2-epimerase (non-hydrolyzing) [Candidatus Sulfotelmatobacter sp.]
MSKIKYLVVFGTRPEAIKMAPVLKALEAESHAETVACSTGQHQELLTPVLDLFQIKPRYHLEVMSPNQQLSGLTCALLTQLEKVLLLERPDRVLVQGDTTTAMAACMAACYLKIPVAHVEAGVRSHNPMEPFPEEMNRKIIDAVSDVFFAPTAIERADLIREGIASDRIFVTGNTSIDALCHVSSLPFSIQGSPLEALPLDKRIILATVHRRENHGLPLNNICQAIRHIARRYSNSAHIVIPVHPNPNVTDCVHRILAGIPNISLTPPLGYREVIALAQMSFLALTDSGGLQEELTWLGKPALVLRNVTDRREAIDAGAARLVGADPWQIVQATTELMENPALYQRMAQPRQLFGDGMAARRIARILQSHHDSECGVLPDTLASPVALQPAA